MFELRQCMKNFEFVSLYIYLNRWISQLGMNSWGFLETGLFLVNVSN